MGVCFISMVLQREVGVGLSEENGQLEIIENAIIETDNRYRAVIISDLYYDVLESRYLCVTLAPYLVIILFSVAPHHTTTAAQS